MRAHNVWRLALLVTSLLTAGLFAVAACAEGEDMPSGPPLGLEPAPTLPPATQTVQLTSEQYWQFGVRTQKIAWASPIPGTTNHEVIPATGIVYDPTGASWIYVSVRPLVYLRTPVVIDHIDRGLAYVDDAPPKGVAVVIAGAAGIYALETASASP
ncbi:MAG: hypothetical protein J2P15_14660 [Micromonosporaceae bacterium]|nr:hypothetical protein [Micromonosporaceae bacterium]